MGAVIDAKSLQTQSEAIEEARADEQTEVLVGGGVNDEEGFFVEPTVIETKDPDFRLLRDELFGPVVTAYVYPEAKWSETLELVDRTAAYGLTGAVFADDRNAVLEAQDALRYAAGNFYVNDKPTGAVVGQQPFGGGRASGTNDKAGSMWNLIRWVSPRTIKETFVPPTDYRYPFMAPDPAETAALGEARRLARGSRGRARPGRLLGAGRIVGTVRADLLLGTASPDRVVARAGNDRIDVAGGGRDRVSCGRGADLVAADGSDRLAADCEVVSRRVSVGSVPRRWSPACDPRRAGQLLVGDDGRRGVSGRAIYRRRRPEHRLRALDRRRPDLAQRPPAQADRRLPPARRVPAGKRSVGRLRRRARPLADLDARHHGEWHRHPRQQLGGRGCIGARRSRRCRSRTSRTASRSTRNGSPATTAPRARSAGTAT